MGFLCELGGVCVRAWGEYVPQVHLSLLPRLDWRLLPLHSCTCVSFISWVVCLFVVSFKDPGDKRKSSVVFMRDVGRKGSAVQQ